MPPPCELDSLKLILFPVRVLVPASVVVDSNPKPVLSMIALPVKERFVMVESYTTPAAPPDRETPLPEIKLLEKISFVVLPAMRRW